LAFADISCKFPTMPKATIPLVLALALQGAVLHGAAMPEMPEAISYTLRFPAPQTHYVEVEARFPTGGRPEIELAMAVWTPGSYLVRGGWLHDATETTAELDYGEALDWYGLRFADAEKSEKPDAKDAGEPKELPAGWLGMDVAVQEGRLTVTVVKRGTPAFEAGVNVGDEVLALDDYRVPPEGLEARLKFYRPGTKASLLVARRDLLVRLPVTFGAKPKDAWKLEPRPGATPAQKVHLAAWLEGKKP
jgi:predicted metalloprotease with PDZ domain